MRTLRRNHNRVITVCPRVSVEDGVELFGEGKQVSLFLEPVTDASTIGMSGNIHTRYLKGIVTHSDRYGVELYGRAYVDRKAPKTHDVLCREADYVIDQQLDYLNHRVLIFKKLEG